MSTELLEPLASFEAAFADLVKRVDDSAWQLTETEVLDVTKRVAALTSKAQGLQVRMVRELDTRSVASTMGATSLRNFLSGALRLSPGEAGRYARLPKALHETCTNTGAALAEGAVNFEQATRITSMVGSLPSKATAEDRAWAEEFLLTYARQLHAEDLAKLAKQIDAAIDPTAPSRGRTSR